MKTLFGATHLIEAAAAPVTGAHFLADAVTRTFQAVIKPATQGGQATATVIIEVSNIDDADTFQELGKLELNTATGAKSLGFASSAPWRYVRARVTATTGVVDVVAGV